MGSSALILSTKTGERDMLHPTLTLPVLEVLRRKRDSSTLTFFILDGRSRSATFSSYWQNPTRVSPESQKVPLSVVYSLPHGGPRPNYTGRLGSFKVVVNITVRFTRLDTPRPVDRLTSRPVDLSSGGGRSRCPRGICAIVVSNP